MSSRAEITAKFAKAYVRASKARPGPLQLRGARRADGDEQRDDRPLPARGQGPRPDQWQIDHQGLPICCGPQRIAGIFRLALPARPLGDLPARSRRLGRGRQPAPSIVTRPAGDLHQLSRICPLSGSGGRSPICKPSCSDLPRTRPSSSTSPPYPPPTRGQIRHPHQNQDRPGRSGKERPRRFRFGQAARFARNKLLGLLPVIISVVWRRESRRRSRSSGTRGWGLPSARRTIGWGRSGPTWAGIPSRQSPATEQGAETILGPAPGAGGSESRPLPG